MGTSLRNISIQSDRPYIVAIGEDKSTISSYLIIVNGKFLSTKTTKFERAFDLLFKSHFVLHIEFDKSLSSFYQFVQSFFYGMEIKGKFTSHMEKLQRWFSDS